MLIKEIEELYLKIFNFFTKKNKKIKNKIKRLIQVTVGKEINGTYIKK